MQTLTTAEKTTQLMVTKKEYPENYGWWISELNSLGVDTKELREASDTVLPEHSASIIIVATLKKNSYNKARQSSAGDSA